MAARRVREQRRRPVSSGCTRACTGGSGAPAARTLADSRHVVRVRKRGEVDVAVIGAAGGTSRAREALQPPDAKRIAHAQARRTHCSAPNQAATKRLGHGRRLVLNQVA
jgi:hypothetical protein